MLGYDSFSPINYLRPDKSTPNDDQIVQICLSEFRILISKDYEIIKKMQLKIDSFQIENPQYLSLYNIPSLNSSYPCLLLRSNDIIINLAQLHHHFNISLEYGIENTRCPKCNHRLSLIQNPVNYKKKIPPNVYKYHSTFWKCSNLSCGKLFWKGTHLERIEKTLKKVVSLSKNI
jgi:uncharacterized protein with PIN domain